MPRTEDAAAKSDSSNATLCDTCSKALQKPLVCARCKTATYCSKDCQVLTRAPQTNREKKSHANASPSLSPTRTLSLCCCQIKAWKAGHKGNCVAAARADTTASKPTADQMRVLKMLEQLAGAADWRGVAAQNTEYRIQRRSARPGLWQPPCGLRCRATLRMSTAPSATRIRSWGTSARPSSTRRST